jgi:hypothetical protein
MHRSTCDFVPEAPAGKVSAGGVSERPKEHDSKSCEGKNLRGFKSHRHRSLKAPNLGAFVRFP